MRLVHVLTLLPAAIAAVALMPQHARCADTDAATALVIKAQGGRFQPSIFGWMVHVYPYEDGLDKIFTMHHHMD